MTEIANAKVAERINRLKGDRIHGAGWLSRQSVNTLKLAIAESQAQTVTDLVEEIKVIAAELMQARPAMTPIANYVSQFLHQIIQRSQQEKDLSSLKSFAVAEGNKIIKSSAKALIKAVEYGCGIINDLDTVITCSYSSTVCKVFELAKQKETEFRVIVAESRSVGQVYGEITAEHLRKHSIPVEVIPDDKINSRIARASKALVGADSITADGYLINGVPTFTLAQAANRHKIPFYTVCETAKLDVRGYMTEASTLEPGFDKTPLELVTGIITEKGTMKPSLVIAYMEEMGRQTG